jgi:hypothetical protein
VQNIRITVNDSSAQEEDLNLLPCGSFTGRQACSVLFAQNAPTTVPRGRIQADTGFVHLRVGDNVTTDGFRGAFPSDEDATRVATVRAGTWIDIFGDFGNADGGWGSVMHLHGELWSGWDGTANFGGTLLTLCNSSDNPDAHACKFTRVFGNNDVDTINFDETYLRNKTRAYGSNTPTAYGLNAPVTVDGLGRPDEDFFFVNYLQTMDSADGNTLTLDGQSATDTYVINTTGSRSCLSGASNGAATCHNYIINVLDTGAPDDGSDVLIVNGYDNPQSGYDGSGNSYSVDDIFLLRRSKYIAATPASTTPNELAHNPAFVALLHGTLGVINPVFTGTITAFRQTITRTDGGSFLANGIVAGQRIRLSSAGVFSGDYTVTAVSASTITVAELMPAGVSLTTD